MRLLAIAPQPFFSPRGTPFSVYFRSQVMAEQGVQIDLLTYGPGEEVDIPGVRVVRIPRIRWLEPIPVGPSWQKALLDVLMILWSIGLLIRNRYAVVHAHEEAVFWCAVLKPLFRFRLIYDMHSSLPQQLVNFSFTRSQLLIGLFKWLEDRSLQTADAVITICPDLRDYVVQLGVDVDRHVMIENSIFGDVRLPGRMPSDGSNRGRTPLELDARDRVILYAGTLEAYQGIELLLEAFARVVPVLPEARLVIVGGTERQVETVRTEAVGLGIESRCVLTGQVPHREVAPLVSRANVLVSPRTSGTNTPLKVYEQISSGRPLVATRIWSHMQVLDDSMCVLVEPTVGSLAEGLISALTNDAESAARARRAQVFYAQHYSRPAYERKVRQLLELLR